MKKILFITDFYYENQQAQGACVHEVAKDFIKRGFEVHCLCNRIGRASVKDEYEGVIVHRERPRFFFQLRVYSEKNSLTLKGRILFKLAMFLQKIKIIITLPWYPLLSVTALNRIFRKTKDLHNTFKYDIVVSTFSPLESTLVGKKLKKFDNKISFVMYTLDTLTNTSINDTLISNYKQKMGRKWEKKILKDVDLILNMKCHEQHYNKQEYDIYQHKMRIVDIPTFKKQEVMVNKESRTDISLLYAGSIGSTRSPIAICDCVAGVRTENVTLQFYSRGVFQSELLEYQKKTNNKIVANNFVSPDVLQSIIDNTDMFISIGNDMSEMIPSKIFTYMSTGKPIIHFFNKPYKESDAVIPYLERYGNYLLIDKMDELTENINKIDHFFKNSRDTRVDFTLVQERFKENFPDYTTQVILDFLGE